MRGMLCVLAFITSCDRKPKECVPSAHLLSIYGTVECARGATLSVEETNAGLIVHCTCIEK